MPYRVVMSEPARKSFEAADGSLQRRLDRCFEMLKLDPRRHPNIKPLQGALAGLYCYRVGDYRIIYRIRDAAQTVEIATIAHRREVYD